jgi:hypothetical protein
MCRSVIDLNKTYSAILHQLKLDLGSLEPRENDQIVFAHGSGGEEGPGGLHATLTNLGSIVSSAHFRLTKVSNTTGLSLLSIGGRRVQAVCTPHWPIWGALSAQRTSGLPRYRYQ